MPVLSATSVPRRRWSGALTALVAGLTLIFAGCGQKGPLTLPQVSATSAAASAPAR